MSAPTPQSWAVAFLKALNVPVTQNNLTSILAWEHQESGVANPLVHWNPLNTTRDSATYGTLAGNSAGVAVYPSYEVGLKETIATIKLSCYDKVRADLKASANPNVTTADIKASPWGTWPGAISPAGDVELASTEVRAHPSWFRPVRPTATLVRKTTPKGGAGSSKGRPHQPGPPSKPPAGGGTGGGGGTKAPTGGGGSAVGASGGGTIVLDLAELGRLSRSYQNASDELGGTGGVRSTLQALYEELTQPLAALTDRSLAANIDSTLGVLTELHHGFDSNARQMDDISYFTGEIRRLAQKADLNADGTYSPSEIKKFVATDPTHKELLAWSAVFEALNGGTIRKSVPKPKGGGGKKPAKPKVPAGAGGHGGKGPKPPGSASHPNKPASRPNKPVGDPKKKMPGLPPGIHVTRPAR